jgi:hypothetical protein
MSRPGVTYQDIVTASNQLKGQGKSITIENIRAFLGTGSIGTINKYLKQWRQTQESTHKIASREELPESLVALIKGLWEGVLSQAAERFTPLESEYKQEITELKSEAAKYQANNQRWQKLFTQWQQEKLQLDNEKLTLEQAVSFNQKENTNLTAKYDGALQQLQEKQIRIDELHRLHQQAQQNLEHYRESAREQRLLEQQQFEREKQQLQMETKALQQQFILNREEMLHLQQKYQDAQQKYTELESQLNTKMAALDSLQLKFQELDKLSHEIAHAKSHWENQFFAQQTLLDDKISALMDAKTELTLVKQQCADSQGLLNDSRNHNRLLADDKLILLQENADLKGQLKQLQRAITS